MILDSSFLFDLMAEDSDAFDKGVELVERGEVQWLPTPVLAEVSYGASRTRSQTSIAEVRNWLLAYPRVSLCETIARRSGELLAEADDHGGGDSGIGWNDAHIAATADRLDDAVLTQNVADFEALRVPVETY